MMDNGRDIFDLEQGIMRMWGTADDLELLYSNVMEKEMSKDDIANALLGLISLHNMRGEKCFGVFENVCRDYHRYKKQAFNF